MIDPNEADFLGFGPQIGNPGLHLPDGRRVAISTWSMAVVSGIGVMTFEMRNGRETWACYFWAAKWQCVRPQADVPDEQTLCRIIAEAGGPAPFILDVMARSSKALAGYLGFAPMWTDGDCGRELDRALDGWSLKAIVPERPEVLVLPTPK